MKKADNDLMEEHEIVCAAMILKEFSTNMMDAITLTLGAIIPGQYNPQYC
jgi:hypothetical protein